MTQRFRLIFVRLLKVSDFDSSLGDTLVYECDLAEMSTLAVGENKSRPTPRRLVHSWRVNGLMVELFPGIAAGRCEQEMQIMVCAIGHGFVSWVTHFIKPGAFGTSKGTLFDRIADTKVT